MSSFLTKQEKSALVAEVEKAVFETPVTDIHTHLYDQAFRDLLLWGIDDLLIYHYLVAETLRQVRTPYDDFWALPRPSQAELVWQGLFVEHSPISEACRGVLTTLNALGLDPRSSDLSALRRYFQSQTVERHVDRCLELANVRRIYMTNSPFDDSERATWERGFHRDERFEAGLRIDPLLLSWSHAVPRLRQWGYDVEMTVPGRKCRDEVRRFLSDWGQRTQARYVMVSLPPDFEFPDKSITSDLIQHCVIPYCEEAGIPLAVMPGVKRAVNPQLQSAGDGVGLSNLSFLQNLCAGFPQNKFLCTVLARENQHELAVLARKFRNLHIFGCWWFTNTPSLIREITRMRLELLGPSFTAQHSDARVLDQLIYKWRHSRRILAETLAEAFLNLAETGWRVTSEEIRRESEALLGGAFENFCAE